MSPRCAPAAICSTIPAGRWTPRSCATDITILGVPFGKMCVEAFERDRDRTLLRNIAYAGALAALLSIDMDVITEALNEKFSKKKALLDANFTAIRLGYDFAKANFKCPLPFHLEKMDATNGHILIDGNTAAALGAVYAGATVGAWYPITPATSLMEAFKEFCEQYRVDATTKEKRYCIIQAEDELAAAGIVIGASGRGRARSRPRRARHSLMRSSSGSRTTPRHRPSSSTYSARGRAPACQRARSRAT